MNARSRMKTLKIMLGLVAVALFFSGCDGGYVDGGDAGPYLGIWGPYGDGDYFPGGYGYHHYAGLHHFYGHSFAFHHVNTGFRGGGFHGGGFHGAGGHR